MLLEDFECFWNILHVNINDEEVIDLLSGFLGAKSCPIRPGVLEDQIGKSSSSAGNERSMLTTAL